MNKINFLKELELLKKPIWNVLKKYLIKREPFNHYQAVNEYPQRQGKYFRAGLVQLSAVMHGGKIEDAQLTAVAMQFSEDFLLVHDDFFDQSDERRSTKEIYKPSLNKIFGDEIAVNAGDALQALMWKVLGENVRMLGDERGWKIFDKMNEIILTTLEGQYLELDWIKNKKIDLSENDYFLMIDKKAGFYTVSGPLQLGSIIAKKYDKNLNNILKWGIPFGRAFQIWDDVMNLTIASNVQGKEQGGDILEGKRTLILIHLLNNCSENEKEKIQLIYNKNRKEKNIDEINYVLNLMNKYGSIKYAKQKAKYFSKKSLQIFDKLTLNIFDNKEKEIIREGINFVVNRDR